MATNAPRIILDTPPPKSTLSRKPKPIGRPVGSGPVQKYLARLAKKHPNQWALYSKSMKSPQGLRRFKSQYPGLEMTTRKNDDGTFRVWVRIMAPNVTDASPEPSIGFTEESARRTQYVNDPRNYTNVAEVASRGVFVVNRDGQQVLVNVQTEED